MIIDQNNIYSKNIVLIDENDNFIGLEDKILGHNLNTKLHRGFSLFLINNQNQLLLQKRSNNKITWPNFWSNSVCGHPQENETYVDAVIRCTKYELNICLNKSDIKFVTKQIYKFTYNNIAEHEFCCVFFAYFNDSIKPNLLEIEEVKYCNINDNFNKEKQLYTPWFLLWLPYIKHHINNTI